MALELLAGANEECQKYVLNTTFLELARPDYALTDNEIISLFSCVKNPYCRSNALRLTAYFPNLRLPPSFLDYVEKLIANLTSPEDRLYAAGILADKRPDIISLEDVQAAFKYLKDGPLQGMALRILANNMDRVELGDAGLCELLLVLQNYVQTWQWWTGAFHACNALATIVFASTHADHHRAISHPHVSELAITIIDNEEKVEHETIQLALVVAAQIPDVRSHVINSGILARITPKYMAIANSHYNNFAASPKMTIAGLLQGVVMADGGASLVKDGLLESLVISCRASPTLTILLWAAIMNGFVEKQSLVGMTIPIPDSMFAKQINTFVQSSVGI